MNRILLITALIAVLVSNVFAEEYKMRLHTLYLHAKVDGKIAKDSVSADQNSIVAMMMDSYGLNYDTVDIAKDTFKLEDGDTALYNTIVVEGFSQAQLTQVKAQIEPYQKKYNLRVVYLNCEPDVMLGFKQNGWNPVTTAAMRHAKLTPQALELTHQYQLKGDDVIFNIENCVLRDPSKTGDCIAYHHREVIYDEVPNVKITPLIKYLNFTNDQDDIGSFGGVLVDNNSLQEMHLWTPFIESHIAFFVSHIWIPWANYGMIDGYRRLFMEIQIDDYFTDNCFNSTECDGKRSKPGIAHYRTSVQDMINLAQWHHDVSGRLPEGSKIQIELAINGFHIINEMQHKLIGGMDWTDPQEMPYNYTKPLGEVVTHRWPQQFDSDWDDQILQNEDPLYKYFKDPNHQDDFYWLTHTFSHMKLDVASYYDSFQEIKVNIKMSDEPYLGMYNRPCFSKHSIVTPEISGLHNGDNLKAFTENQVYYAVGDTSRVDLSPANFYFPYITNMTQSNFDGFVVFPRQPPQIYWFCSTIEENMSFYYERYPQLTNVNWEMHLDNEAVLHVKNFLKLRHDPYMFHEGNLRNEDFPETVVGGKVKGKFGMMQQWVERMVIELNKYFDLPVLSVKMDDLAATYIDRISRDSCKPYYTMVIDKETNIIKEVKVESTNELELSIVGDYPAKCRAPLLAMRNAGFMKNDEIEIEKIGKEPETGWIVLDKPGSPKSFKFAKEIKYTDETFVGKELSDSSFFSKYKLYIMIGGGVLLFLLVAIIIVMKIRGRKSGNQGYQTKQNNNNYNYQSNPQYNQYSVPQEPPKSYQNMNSMYDRNDRSRDYMNDYDREPRSPRTPRTPRSPRSQRDDYQRNDYQDNQKRKDYKNYQQLYDEY
ncbi:hypothetical protein PIROE2DRAFT_14877 [Piromyces sp. E2]|nr:hypothetical protein PIROE2DRAFT_14877 [Piromyces sp. E2]|eukprot:OUM59544.1 hypothetical protein PIROE2DRAFT_14877 [Piromyces sp. E2]